MRIWFYNIVNKKWHGMHDPNCEKKTMCTGICMLTLHILKREDGDDQKSEGIF